MSANYYKLKFPFEYVNKGMYSAKYAKLVEDRWHWISPGIDECITTEAKHQLLSIGVKDFRTQLFYGYPGMSTDIHEDAKVDDKGNIHYGSTWALNVCWGSKNHIMSWYRILNNSTKSAKGNSADDKFPRIQFRIFDASDVEEVENVSISGVTLVRINVPHAVFNYDTRPRHCLSIRESTQNWTWEEAVKRFRPWIIQYD